MTGEDPERTEDQYGRRRAATVVAIVAVALLATCGALTAVSTPGAATVATVADNNTSINNSDYYNGTMDVDNESWFAGIGEADLDSLGKLATRAGGYFIGTGNVDASGTGFQGVLLTGVIMSVGMIGAVAGLGVGAVGGSVIAVVIGFSMTELGLAPAWFRVLLLFGIGIIAYVALTNILEAR